MMMSVMMSLYLWCQRGLQEKPGPDFRVKGHNIEQPVRAAGLQTDRQTGQRDSCSEHGVPPLLPLLQYLSVCLLLVQVLF